MPEHDLKQEIARLAVKRRSDDILITSPDGDVLDWIIDLRAAFMNSEILFDLARRFWDTYADRQGFQIVGIEAASIPLLTAILLATPASHRNVCASYIRKERKKYGLGRYVEGNISQEHAILIDDIVNSGDSISRAVAALDEEGVRVEEVYCVIDYRNPASEELAALHDFRITSVYVLSDFGLNLEFSPIVPKKEYERQWVHLAKKANTFHVVPKSAPVVVGHLIYRGCDDGMMQAFNAETGGVVWEFQATGAEPGKGIWSTPAIADGRLYFGGYNGIAYCLDARTGSIIWQVQCGDWIGASPLVVPKHNLVYVGVEYSRQWAHGSIAALDISTGNLVWHHPVAGLQHGSPAYWERGDLIIWGTADYEMLGIRAGSGEVVWSFNTERSVKCAPVVDETRGIIAFASFDQNIYALDASNGELLGKWMTEDICYTTPLIVGNRLYCGSADGNLYVVNVELMEIESVIRIGSRVYSSPRLISDYILFGANCGRVFSIDPESLECRTVLMLPDAITNALASSEDGENLYISTNVNHLYRYERL